MDAEVNDRWTNITKDETLGAQKTRNENFLNNNLTNKNNDGSDIGSSSAEESYKRHDHDLTPKEYTWNSVDSLRDNQQGAIPKIRRNNSHLTVDDSAYLQKDELRQYTSAELLLNNKANIIEDQLIGQITAGYKVMIIMRGAPGSGKSHLATTLLKKCSILNEKFKLQDFILSADDYFYDNQGRYKYNVGKLEDAHVFNQNRAKEKAASGWSPIIIDNTNIKFWEMMPYVQIAVSRGYIVHLLEPNTPWRHDAGKLAMKNQHRVTREKIKLMLDNYERGTVNDLLNMLKETKYTVPLPQLRNVPSIPISSNVDTSDGAKEFDNLEIVERNVEDGSTGCGGNNKYTFVDSSLTLVSPKPQRRHIRSKIALAMDDGEKATSETMSHSAWKPHEAEMEQFWCRQSGCNGNTFMNAPLEDKCDNEKTLLDLLKEGVADISKEIEKDKSTEQPAVLFEMHKIGCYNENKSFANLRQIYPNKSLRGLWDLFVKCKGDLDWVVDILLREDELSMTGIYASQYDQTEETTFNCTCDNKYICSPDNKRESESPQNSELNFKRSKPQRSGRIRSKNEIQTQLSAIALKEAVENCIGFGDERHTKHVGKMQSMQEEIQNVDSVKTYVDAEVQTELFELSDEENQESSGSEFLEISLGDHLVKQLCDIFSSETVNRDRFPDNLITNVFIPKTLARELFMLWMESAYNQIGENQQNSLRDDENFARLLKNPKYENVKESPDNIKEILDMELALIMYEDDRKGPEQLKIKQQPSDIATSLTQMKLCELFPNIPRETLVDIFEAQGNKFNETLSILQENIESNPLCRNFSEQESNNGKNRLNNQVVDEKQQRFKEFPSKNVSNNYVGPFKLQFQTEEAKRLTLHDFEEARNFAAHHSQLKAECYLKAKEAIQKGNNYVAVYYSQIANLHKKKIDMYNHRAANCIAEVHKYTQNNPDLLDLHYLHILEAVGCLDVFLDRHITNLRSLSKAYKHVFIITGRGLHSAGGVSTIKNKVKSRLKERSLRWSEVNPGLLKVKVFSASRYSKNM